MASTSQAFVPPAQMSPLNFSMSHQCPFGYLSLVCPKCSHGSDLPELLLDGSTLSPLAARRLPAARAGNRGAPSMRPSVSPAPRLG